MSLRMTRTTRLKWRLPEWQGWFQGECWREQQPDNLHGKKEEKKEEKKDKKYLRREFSYSKFQQTILLPENVEKDKISAKVEHGILSIEIPKMKEEEKQKTSKAIEVK